MIVLISPSGLLNPTVAPAGLNGPMLIRSGDRSRRALHLHAGSELLLLAAEVHVRPCRKPQAVEVEFLELHRRRVLTEEECDLDCGDVVGVGEQVPGRGTRAGD